jgi:hypothetical protein
MIDPAAQIIAVAVAQMIRANLDRSITTTKTLTFPYRPMLVQGTSLSALLNYARASFPFLLRVKLGVRPPLLRTLRSHQIIICPWRSAASDQFHLLTFFFTFAMRFCKVEK